ncbi:DUF3187 family protein [Geobacter sp. AOG1]|uniref:DUF3187 family protein n=1 Tax=Geobacter sp. AOG1 TaxID=1566346 RepID=UPI001CC436F2|nr:DUF3187 family protein [Geobacter sp. AOG1]GFE57886.1 hypothetical protein AOG1_17660 [Geobacter sp. AOG1]
MINSVHHFLWSLALLVCALAIPHPAFSLELTPFQTFNQSPLVQIYGLPAPESGTTVPARRLDTRLSLDIASNFAVDTKGAEAITLDGETYRTTLAFRYGVTNNIELGLDIPYIVETGGIFDSPIQWWHHVFNMSQAGRDEAPKNRLLFTYSRNGAERFSISHGNDGVGDIRLSGGVQLYREDRPEPLAVALRASLKLPTGNSGKFQGSGGTDFALWLSALDQYEGWGLYGAVGGMTVGKGDVLTDMQRDVAAFGCFGIGLTPVEWLALKMQLYGNTPFYKGSSIKELSVASLQWVFGQTVAFTPDTELDIAVAEDLLALTTSPDFGIHVALRIRF